MQNELLKMSNRIYGDEIFFDFREIAFDNLSGNLIDDVKHRKIDGFVTTEVFSKEEVNKILSWVEKADHKYFTQGSTGWLFPAPFAIITDTDEKLNDYFNKLSHFHSYIAESGMTWFTERLHQFFEKCGSNFQMKVPLNKVVNKGVAPGNIRIFDPLKGGIPVHCGNYFQWRHTHFWSLLEDGIDMNDQLSFFVLLQNAKQGGELTIYDMLWDNVKQKPEVENDEAVINDAGETISLKDIRHFTVKPQPGDILIFAGGPIWHRVENIRGEIPRMTFGGFINFSKDNTKCYYWS